jgi:hypothetical protein
MESWRLKDDLDLEDFGGSWLSHSSNSEFLEGAELALFRRIQGNAELRAMFLTKGKDGSVVLCPTAMAIYEAHAQDQAWRNSGPIRKCRFVPGVWNGLERNVPIVPKRANPCRFSISCKDFY